MKKSPLVTFCIIASLLSILVGIALMITALSPATTSEWGAIATGFTPHAILISGGLISLAICGSCGDQEAGAIDRSMAAQSRLRWPSWTGLRFER